MLWGCFASTGTRNLQHIEGIMDSVRYKDITAKNVNPSVKKWKFGRHWTFQQDNDLKHTSKSMFHCGQIEYSSPCTLPIHLIYKRSLQQMGAVQSRKRRTHVLFKHLKILVSGGR